MPENDPGSEGSIEDRADERVQEILDDALEEGGFLRAVGIYCGAQIWQFLKSCLSHLEQIIDFFKDAWREDSPEREFIEDLSLDVGVSIVYTLWLRIFALTVIANTGRHSPVRTFRDGVLLDVLELTHYTPLVILFVYQIFRFLRYLKIDWEHD